MNAQLENQTNPAIEMVQVMAEVGRDEYQLIWVDKSKIITPDQEVN